MPSAVAIRPSSSRLATAASTVRSPSAIALSARLTAVTDLRSDRAVSIPKPPRIPTPSTISASTRRSALADCAAAARAASCICAVTSASARSIASVYALMSGSAALPRTVP